MKRKLWIYILLTLLVIPVSVEAQRWKLQRYEAVIGLGTTHPFVDVGKAADDWKAFQLKATRPTASFSAAYKILDPFSVGLELSYMMFGGEAETDMPLKSFTTHSFEHAAIFRYSFISNGRAFGSTALFNRRGMVNNYNSADFYIFGGFGGILTKSIAYDELQQRMDYAHYHDNIPHYGVVFPMGFGFKYSIDSDWSFGVEVGGRFTLTDWIDGFHAEPYDSGTLDRYLTTNFRAIYKVRNDRKGRPRFSSYGR